MYIQSVFLYISITWSYGTSYVCELIQHVYNESFSCNMHLSIVAGLVVRHGDLSHEMTLSHEGRRPECDNVDRV